MLSWATLRDCIEKSRVETDESRLCPRSVVKSGKVLTGMRTPTEKLHETHSGHVRQKGTNTVRATRRQLVAGAGAAGVAIAAHTRTSGAEPESFALSFISAQDDPVEIVFANIWGTPLGGEAPEEKHPAQQVIDAFNDQSPSIQVTSRTDSSDYYELLQKVQAELAAGDPPALVITPWASIHYANEGLGIIGLEEIAGDEVAEVFSNLRQQVIPLVQVGEETLGLPYAFSCPVLYYNADVLAEAGVDPEVLFESWSSFRQEAPKVQEVLDGNPVIAFSSRGWVAQSIIQCNGGQVMSETTNEPMMDRPEAIEAMATIAELNTAGLYDRSARAQVRPSFIGGSTAVYQGSIASLGGLRNSVTFDLQTTTFPVFEGMPRRMASGGSFIGVYAREKEQQQAAWEFLKFALTEEAYAIWMQTGYLNATKYDLPRLEGQEPAYIQLEEGLTRETAWPTARGAELKVIWDNYVDRIWANDISAEEGCKAAAEEISAIIESAS